MQLHRQLLSTSLVLLALSRSSAKALPDNSQLERPVEAVLCNTTQGPLRIAVRRDWAPAGAERFISLVDAGFFTDHPLYRSVFSQN